MNFEGRIELRWSPRARYFASSLKKCHFTRRLYHRLQGYGLNKLTN